MINIGLNDDFVETFDLIMYLRRCIQNSPYKLNPQKS